MTESGQSSDSDGGYGAVTHGFEVRVEPFYLADHSEPSENRYVWAYRVAIANHGSRAARLVSRHWDIVDANGSQRTVSGPGVVGQTPLITPGDTFEYHSGCPLDTPGGTMAGHYTMVDDEGGSFEITIPSFSLDVPGEPRTLN